jgi:hypothetical protein
VRADQVSGAGGDERRLALGAARALALLAVPVVTAGAVVAGWSGAASAAVGLGFVFVLFGASAALLAYVAATRSSEAGVRLLILGAVVRLPLYIVALSVLERMAWVHPRSLAGATAFAIAVTLAYELHLLRRMPRLFWIDAAAGAPSAVATDTRSPAL